MKRNLLVLLMVLAVAGFAAAQKLPPTSDVLGAHLNYGRGCAGCHAPHSGAYGNGAAKTADPNAGTNALWGQDVGSLYGKTILFGQTNRGTYSETLPASLMAATPDALGTMTCLSCHDGNWAQGAMMKNAIYETLPPTYGGWNTIPTLLGDGNGTPGVANYLADHPVGLLANPGCGGQYNWDCTISATGYIQMNGPNSSAFVQNYGFFVNIQPNGVVPTVQCTTCHNQHSMNTVAVTNDGGSCTLGKSGSYGCSGLPTGNYETMFFIEAPYNPASGTAGSNQNAQFCRQCHGGEANESNGSYTIPTIF